MAGGHISMQCIPLARNFIPVIRAFEMTFEITVGIQILLMKYESRAEIRPQRGPASI